MGGTLKGNLLIERDEINEWIKNKIRTGEPFMLARYGSVEATMIYNRIMVDLGLRKQIPEYCFSALYNNAGFFPYHDEPLVERYVKEMLDYSMQVDCLGYWGDGMQEYLVDLFCKPDIKITKLVNIHPYDYNGEAWTNALAGKKVLVVHPFSESISKQYLKRKLIWERTDILPDFELTTLKAVQTIAGTKDNRFATWFEALDYMYTEAMKVDFDVAIIGCGAYGFPLAAKLKMSGKQALHLGGVTQALFGIKGGRFDSYPKFRNEYYNEYWVRPQNNEKPENYKNVENGCYW